MRRVFYYLSPDGFRMVATYQGRIIIATTPRELERGPFPNTLDLYDPNDTISVSEWMREQSARHS
jgi:hypothetical protein